MVKIIIATSNPHKLEEINAINKSNLVSQPCAASTAPQGCSPFKVTTPKFCSHPSGLSQNLLGQNKNIIFDVINEDFNPDENGKTFEENAIIKAKEAAKITKSYCLADDSGLCVDVLEGKPGIYSSRYAPTNNERIEKLLKEMHAIPYDERTAHFICSMVLVNPKGEILHKETGRVFGYIDDTAKGKNGFGYDPIFYLSEYDKTMAELSEEEKNQISHRANALKPMLQWINDNLPEQILR